VILIKRGVGAKYISYNSLVIVVMHIVSAEKKNIRGEYY